jgi:hypothetical protein
MLSNPFGISLLIWLPILGYALQVIRNEVLLLLTYLTRDAEVKTTNCLL